MLYIGRGLRARLDMVEPALLNPRLPVDWRRPDWNGRGLRYWPSYDTIPAASRAAYLTWLCDGRRRPDAPLGYVFLYFYGLERLVLVDAPRNPALRAHLAAVTAEVRRLLGIYSSSRSFASYAGEFLRLLELMGRPVEAAAPPVRTAQRWPVPSELRIGLARFAMCGQPVPPQWALSWAWHHPQMSPRTAQTRCQDEFDRLFIRRYVDRYGDGLRVAPGRRRITHRYQPASAGIAAVEVAANGLPDVVELAEPSRLLAELVTDVTNELDPYSRWLGRNPGGRGRLAGAALLPAPLMDRATGEVEQLRRWARGRLGEDAAVVMDGAELICRWPTETPGRMSRGEAVSLAQLLGSLGFGIEPDVRLGGPPPANRPVVLFRAEQPSTVATPAYAAAATLLHLAVTVSAADGEVSIKERYLLTEHLETALQLTGPERTRLSAHVLWLTATGVKLTGLKKRLDALGGAQRSAISDFLLAVAAADGVVSPSEIKTLTRIHGLLGIDPSDLHDRLHRQLTAARPHSPAPATRPITVRPGRAEATGYMIPTSPVAQPPEPAGVIMLDGAVIAEKLAQTAQVSALLASIFTDDEAQATAAPSAAPPAADVEPVAGLDAAHSALLRALAAQASWSLRDYHDLARRFGVMPAGAVDVLNEAAIELCGEPAVEGDEDIEINKYALQELLG